MDMTMLCVKEFHERFRENTPEEPVALDLDQTSVRHLNEIAIYLEQLAEQVHARALQHRTQELLRVQLMVEELGEFVRALADGDIVAALDALCDQRYVNDGSILSMGLGPIFLAAFREVHRSNMSKLHEGEVVKDAAGRIIKGPEYSKPDLAQFLQSAPK